MTVRRLVPLAAVGATLLVLAVPLVFGSGGARIGAGGAIAGMLAGIYGVARGRQIEHEDDPVRPTTAALVVEGITSTGSFWVAISACIAIIFLAAEARASGRLDDVSWFGPVLAAVAGAALVVAMVWAARSAREKEGLERDVFHESGAIAFMCTVVAAAVYGLFEAFADAPTISMWNVWLFGMVVWGVASTVLRRRAS